MNNGRINDKASGRDKEAGVRARKKYTSAHGTSFVKPTDIVRVKGGIDRPMFVIIVLLLCFGSIMVFSASFASALSQYNDSYYYIKKQILFLVIGFVAMMFMARVDYRILRKFAVIIFIAVAITLIIVPVYGKARGLATRWIAIGGLRFQPSEVMKTSLVLFLAHYMATYQKQINKYSDFRNSMKYGVLIPFIIIGFVAVEIIIEPHLSGAIIILLIGMVVIFAGGSRKIIFAICGVASVVGGAGLLILKGGSYMAERVNMWLHPEKFSALDETWQITQALNAVGSGGLWGVGFGNSTQKYNFVSEPQNDFIFAIICEELGYIGAIAVMALFVLFTWRGVVIAMKAPDTFSSLLVLGIVFKVTLQAILNMCVVTALVPNTGITLPFFSYGGTALVVLLAEMGIILSVSRFTCQEK